MKINSPAGNFLITFEKMEPADGHIQITAKFGAWDAKALMTTAEFWGIIRMAMTPKMIALMIKSLFMFRRSAATGDDSG